MPRIEVTRTVAADPASVALLLSGPAAVDVFADETALAGAGINVEITPPQRSGIGFSAALSVISADRGVARGSINIEAAPGDGTSVVVAIRPDNDVNPAAVRLWLVGALNDLATCVSARSTAA